jgi:tRNA A37 threonylcarbamoyladenosine dehydratase
MALLQSKRVILFGIGGVGSWCAECLIRTGLTHLTIVDGDTVQASNLNRQLPATQATLGMPKVEALKARLLEINPDAEIEARYEMVNGEWLMVNGLEGYDYVIDAIDSVADKTDLLLYASRLKGVKIFSSMGAALRFDPTQVTTGELMSIKGDALAKAVRARMKRLDRHPSKKIRCVYSTEQAQKCETRGSLMQVTAVFGLTLASMVIGDLK